MSATVWRLSNELLGLNRRNHDLIARYNPRALFQVVDHKVKTKAALSALGLPVTDTLAVYQSYREIPDFMLQSRTWPAFVIKPAQGAGGEGILSIVEQQLAEFLTADGKRLSVHDIESHLSDILSGIYSLNQRYDSALIESRITPHVLLERLSFHGLPDIRVIVFCGVPLMAMLRVATRRSRGRANLHAGGIGIGIDLVTGQTTYALLAQTWITVHPDSTVPLCGVQLPYWDDILTVAARCADAVALGYLGVDITVDEKGQPLVLELNARPGLAIQLANRRGLRPLIDEIERRNPRTLVVQERIQLGQSLFLQQ
ncbi:MAG: alpha-L-glutamate ligase-like protein [Deltaproteobacteria bacterium]|nr:alpha-L-glutamate ligase-like protein [Deltaproteobacteria bacterium]